ncbi:four helix bundle protein [Candidatus Shapirobacteria bacterium]|nr:four helix bundle protein [Candidatus Shapirobacteria bacterium]
MKENIVQKKSFEFAVKIINLYKHLAESKKEFVLSKQMLRSGTSIGANVEEAIGGQSKKDFVSKFSIAYKETRETIYWLKLLRETKYIDEKVAKETIGCCDELARIIAAILKSSRL